LILKGEKIMTTIKQKIAVAGATGRVGRHVVDVLKAGGHDVVAMSRSSGVDVVTGDGLAEALAGVECIIDVASPPSPDQEAATAFFTAAARNLHEAGQRAGVQILRAAQFHEFVGPLVEWGRQGEVSYVPKMRTQLVAARTVAQALADLAIDPEWATAPRSSEAPIPEIAGPREESLVDMAKLLVARRGDPVRIEGVSNSADLYGRDMFETGGLLPSPHATLAGPTFEAWLDSTFRRAAAATTVAQAASRNSLKHQPER
jgi:hypothetical protein